LHACLWLPAVGAGVDVSCGVWLFHLFSIYCRLVGPSRLCLAASLRRARVRSKLLIGGGEFKNHPRRHQTALPHRDAVVTIV
jgi:hypothetical protein